MERIDSYGAVAVRPTPAAAGSTKGYFTPGDPTTGTPATRLDRDWFNNVQEEIVSIIEAAGITPDKATSSQMLAAIRLLTGIPSNPAPVTTTDATQTTVASVSVAEGEAIAIEATGVGRKSDGSGFYMAKIFGGFHRNASGNVTQDGAAAITGEINDSAWGGLDLVANTSAQAVDVKVTGLAATTIKWNASVKVTKVSA